MKVNFYTLHKLTGELLAEEEKLGKLEHEEYQLKQYIRDTKNSVSVLRNKLEKLLEGEKSDG